MELAGLELYHSRPFAPTRRLALGRTHLPVSPAPGFGGILLGAVVAKNWAEVNPDLVDDLTRLSLQLQEGQRVVQPRLRNRLQTDRIGLQQSTFRLLGSGDALRFDFHGKGTPEQHVLGAVYAAGRLEAGPRRSVMDAVRKGMRWHGETDADLVSHLAGRARGRSLSVDAALDPVAWALDILGIDANGSGPPGRQVITRQFRDLLRDAHPDHGGETGEAAERIADLTEARAILLNR